ncbi:MAG: HlyD family efflux transporter periplasmic adaptor subunit [Pseudomonadota bacterium]
MNDRAIAKELPLRPTGPGDEPPAPMQQPSPLWHKIAAGIIKGVLPLVILAAAAAAWFEIARNVPFPERSAGTRLPRVVSVVPAVLATAGPRIEGLGAVTAAREVILASEITGRVVEVAPELVADGFLREGTLAFRLDTTELALSVREAEARVAEIEARITMELGQADRARADFERLPLQVTPRQRSLILREPQMAELEAAKAAAVAVRERAQETLFKAAVTVPFDAMVLEEEIERGALLTAGTAAARLAGTERFELRVTLPLTALQWVREGLPVRLEQPGVWPDGTVRMAVVERVGAALDEGGRLAVATIAIDDPLSLRPENANKPLVRLGSYMRAEIGSDPIPGAVELPRRYLRVEDTAWVLNAEKRLERRELEIAWRGADTILVTDGLAPGDRIITTDLGVYSHGMALALEEVAPGEDG